LLRRIYAHDFVAAVVLQATAEINTIAQVCLSVKSAWLSLCYNY
jgi:hypothetical protein